MGTTEDQMTHARPWHRVYVDGYWLDQTEVTNEQFARFVKASGYITIAERKPRQEDYPSAPPDKLIAGSVVFSAPNHEAELTNHLRWWSYVKGANRRHPEGPGSNIKNRMTHPVVHIAYDDAAAYCEWHAARLPTEAEFDLPLAADSTASAMSGAMRSCPMESIWPTRSRVTSRTLTLARTVIWPRRRSDPFPPTDMGFSIWRAMPGSGLRIGTVATTMQR